MDELFEKVEGAIKACMLRWASRVIVFLTTQPPFIHTFIHRPRLLSHLYNTLALIPELPLLILSFHSFNSNAMDVPANVTKILYDMHGIHDDKSDIVCQALAFVNGPLELCIKHHLTGLLGANPHHLPTSDPTFAVPSTFLFQHLIKYPLHSCTRSPVC
jgi:hypothetical protein